MSVQVTPAVAAGRARRTASLGARPRCGDGADGGPILGLGECRTDRSPADAQRALRAASVAGWPRTLTLPLPPRAADHAPAGRATQRPTSVTWPA